MPGSQGDGAGVGGGPHRALGHRAGVQVHAEAQEDQGGSTDQGPLHIQPRRACVCSLLPFILNKPTRGHSPASHMLCSHPHPQVKMPTSFLSTDHVLDNHSVLTNVETSHCKCLSTKLSGCAPGSPSIRGHPAPGLTEHWREDHTFPSSSLVVGAAPPHLLLECPLEDPWAMMSEIHRPKIELFL